MSKIGMRARGRIPGLCGSNPYHKVLPGNTSCEGCGTRIFRHRDRDLQSIYKAYKELWCQHPHTFVAGYCLDCSLERENLHRPWSTFLKRYGTGHDGIPICATRWNHPRR